MTALTQEARAQLRAEHIERNKLSSTGFFCGGCFYPWPCQTVALLDALDEAQAHAAEVAKLRAVLMEVRRNYGYIIPGLNDMLESVLESIPPDKGGYAVKTERL